MTTQHNTTFEGRRAARCALLRFGSALRFPFFPVIDRSRQLEEAPVRIISVRFGEVCLVRRQISIGSVRSGRHLEPLDNTSIDVHVVAGTRPPIRAIIISVYIHAPNRGSASCGFKVFHFQSSDCTIFAGKNCTILMEGIYHLSELLYFTFGLEFG